MLQQCGNCRDIIVMHLYPQATVTATLKATLHQISHKDARFSYAVTLLQDQTERLENIEHDVLLHGCIRFCFAISRIRAVNAVVEAPSVIPGALMPAAHQLRLLYWAFAEYVFALPFADMGPLITSRIGSGALQYCTTHRTRITKTQADKCITKEHRLSQTTILLAICETASSERERRIENATTSAREGLEVLCRLFQKRSLLHLEYESTYGLIDCGHVEEDPEISPPPCAGGLSGAAKSGSCQLRHRR